MLPDQEPAPGTERAGENITRWPTRLKLLLISFLVLYLAATAVIIVIMRRQHQSRAVQDVVFQALSPGRESIKRHGVRFVLDTRAAPDMRSWGEEELVVLSQWYPKILLILSARDFHPPSTVILQFDKFRFVPFPSSDTKRQPYMVQSGTNVTFVGGSGNVAFTVGDMIHLWARHYRYDRSDGGSLVHEEVHVLQGGAGPSWLVEGIADYIRWYLYEPAPLNPPMGGLNCNPQYNNSYQITANFLAYVTRRYGDVIGPLTVAMRQHRYNDSIWKKLTGVDLSTLNSQWRAQVAESIRKGYFKTVACR